MVDERRSLNARRVPTGSPRHSEIIKKTTGCSPKLVANNPAKAKVRMAETTRGSCNSNCVLIVFRVTNAILFSQILPQKVPSGSRQTRNNLIRKRKSLGRKPKARKIRRMVFKKTFFFKNVGARFLQRLCQPAFRKAFVES